MLIAIFADALGYCYTRYPLIQKALERTFPSVVPLRSMLGYSAGIMPSIWTSSYPHDHGYWAEWVLKSDYVPRLLRIRRTQWIMRCLFLYGVKTGMLFLTNRSSLNPALPTAITKVFSCRNFDVTTPFILKAPPSLFWILQEYDIRYRYCCCRKIEDLVLPKDERTDIIIYHLGELDGLGHSLGPKSDQLVHRILTLLDRVDALAKKADGLCLFSDHGMFPIKRRIDLLAVLETLSPKLGLDYLVFLDATMARFWFFSNQARTEIMSSLSDLTYGHFLTSTERDDNGLNFNTEIYGQEIYLVNPSVEIFPNFFHPLYKGFFKGLHGYTASALSSWAMFATTLNLQSTTGSVLDISPTILQLLNVSSQQEWKGKSLIN